MLLRMIAKCLVTGLDAFLFVCLCHKGVLGIVLPMYNFL